MFPSCSVLKHQHALYSTSESLFKDRLYQLFIDCKGS